jgi:hypothetical protein
MCALRRAIVRNRKGQPTMAIKAKDLPPCPDFTGGLGTAAYIEKLCREVEAEKANKSPAAPATVRTTAYQVTVRQISNGCDYHVRLFSHSPEHASERAIYRARIASGMSLARHCELRTKGIAVFRVVSCEVSQDQSRPVG